MNETNSPLNKIIWSENLHKNTLIKRRPAKDFCFDSI